MSIALGPYFNSYEESKIPFPYGSKFENGVPLTNLKLIGLGKTDRYEYHPTPIIQYGIANWNSFLKQNKESQRDSVLSCADWVSKTIVESNEQPYLGIRIPFPHKSFGLKSHWVSGMVQGQALSLLLRANEIESKASYYNALEKCLESLVQPKKYGGVAQIDDHEFFVEEAGNLKILNGFLYALIGLIEYHSVFANATTAGLISKGLNYIHNHIHDYDLGWWSKYCLGLPYSVSDNYYHKVHIKQLETIDRLLQKSDFKDIIDKWKAYELKLDHFRFKRARIKSILAAKSYQFWPKKS